MSKLLANSIRPAIGRFKKTHPLQSQVVTVGILEYTVEYRKCPFGKILRSRNAIEHDSLVVWNRLQEVYNPRVARIDQKGVIPVVYQMLLRQRFDLGEVHHHTVGWIARLIDDIATKGDFQRIAMPMQMATLTPVVGNSMTGVKLKAAGNEHQKLGGNTAGDYIIAPMDGSQDAPPIAIETLRNRAPMLSILNHSRNIAGMTYIYPVLSRRAGGVSIGINLNVNNACNWACIYCQVPELTRGGPPPVDLDLLEDELRRFLPQATGSDFLARLAPPESRRVVDVAFSGNGEPTSASEFADAVDRVGRVLQDLGLLDSVKLRLITNGSLIHRLAVRRGIAAIGALDGEVWFKLDRATTAGISSVNGVCMTPERICRSLRGCAALAPTWVQTCYFAIDGAEPSEGERAAYLALVEPFKGKIKGVLLYGLARPSMQPGAGRLSSLSQEKFQRFANSIASLGIEVVANP